MAKASSIDDQSESPVLLRPMGGAVASGHGLPEEARRDHGRVSTPRDRDTSGTLTELTDVENDGRDVSWPHARERIFEDQELPRPVAIRQHDRKCEATARHLRLIELWSRHADRTSCRAYALHLDEACVSCRVHATKVVPLVVLRHGRRGATHAALVDSDGVHGERLCARTSVQKAARHRGDGLKVKRLHFQDHRSRTVGTWNLIQDEISRIRALQGPRDDWRHHRKTQRQSPLDMSIERTTC